MFRLDIHERRQVDHFSGNTDVWWRWVVQCQGSNTETACGSANSLDEAVAAAELSVKQVISQMVRDL